MKGPAAGVGLIVVGIAFGMFQARAEQTLRIGGNVTIIDGVMQVDGKQTAVEGFVRGSGKAAKSERTLDAFERAVVDISADVSFSRGSTSACVIHGDDNLLPLVTTEVRQGTLHISASKGFSSRSPLRIEVRTPGLEGLVLDGSGVVTLNQVTNRELTVTLAGSGDIVARGKVEELMANLDGAGNMDLSDLSALNVRARLDGSGDLLVNASGQFSGVINGSGDIIVRGGARINQARVLGAGEIVTD